MNILASQCCRSWSQSFNLYMKFIHSLAVLFVSQQIMFCQSPPATQGPVNLKFIVTDQTISGEMSQTIKTNADTTNIITTTTYITTNWVLDNAKLLQIIGDAYRRSFQPGATLMLDQNTNFIVAVGTNVVLNLSNILTLTPDNMDSLFVGSFFIPDLSGKFISKQRIGRTGISEQTEDNYVLTSMSTLNYDDSSLTLPYLKTTHFSVKGIEKQQFRITANGTNEVVINFMTFTGVGNGGIHPFGSYDRQIFLRGDFVGKLTGSLSAPSVENGP
jgi:hypothetical protein